MKTAIVGVGRMGRRHVEAARNVGAEIVALVDLHRSTAIEAAAEAGLDETVAFDNFQKALDKTRPEAVVVATTAPTHCEFVCAAAEAGVRYILCEKPLAVSIAEARTMIDICRRTGALLAVNHQMRFMPQYTEIKTLVDSPELGGLSSILVAAGNFGVAMNGSHYFEMFRYMMDETASTVQAWFDPDLLPNPRGAAFEDRSGQIRVEAASGRTMYMDLSARAGHGLQVTYICRYGQIIVDELGGFARVIRREDAYRDLPTTRYGMPAVDEQIAVTPADVIAPTEAVWRTMLNGGPFPDGLVGLHTIQCLAAAHSSHDKGGARVAVADAVADRVFPWA